MILARNNEKNVAGIVINAFSAPVVINRELFDLIEEMNSSLEVRDEDYYYLIGFCDNAVMKSIVDKFGMGIATKSVHRNLSARRTDPGL